MVKWFIQKFLPYCPMLGNIHSQISRFFDKIPQHRYCNNIVGVTIGAFTKILAQWDYRQNNHQWCEYHGNRWVAVNNRTARTICWVQKVTSLYCNVAFKTRERHHLCHIMIWYSKSKLMSGLKLQNIFIIHTLPSSTWTYDFFLKWHWLNFHNSVCHSKKKITINCRAPTWCNHWKYCMDGT